MLMTIEYTDRYTIYIHNLNIKNNSLFQVHINKFEIPT